MARIGVQAMMLKQSVQEIGAFETLRRVREMGYAAVEISQIPMDEANVGQLERAREELGIDIAALSAGPHESPGVATTRSKADLDKIIADARRLGADMVRIGMLPFDAMSFAGSRARLLRPHGDAGRAARGLRHPPVLPQPPHRVREVRRAPSARHHRGPCAERRARVGRALAPARRGQSGRRRSSSTRVG